MANILFLNASNSSRSIHKVVLDALNPLLNQHNITYSSILDYDLPFYSEDKEREQGHPPAAKDFVELLHKQDIILLACPEHNGAPPAEFKNLYDWGTRVAAAASKSLFNQRKVIIITTSGGERGGATVANYLSTITPYHGANVVGTHSIAKFYENFVDGVPSDSAKNLLQAIANDVA
ncbi:NAD(P)H-dependent oxidoreductase [[Haemophilus] felis]|uniref:NADPH-dependent fmn reductase n=1 Tax=[Haemophilus] felis TaxID=123822 RepID=A0A1T0B8Q3_9PAST|nr:NAD(P)H-dependent oxidoreductase [[Haemophilus] felis]NBI40994.1 NAD(P)H-dependent oxidoreductase [[Haemophilus] felis]NBI42886.1 NAD(P)H-dependent oxidoreductase [[Haemophilus] felis]OOS06396.1 NADPH-dependent fmn reductase [[Haemophilus] felis]